MLDIDAFSSAMRRGTVGFLQPLGLRPFEDEHGEIVTFRDDDAIVYPLAREGGRPEYALRLPLDEGSSRLWPEHYADLASLGGAIREHLPREITILDVERMPGLHVALLYDWVSGETLTVRVTRARTRQERDQLADLLWPLADVAEALRISGIVHGDIAPGNLVVRPDGGITLIDLDRLGHQDGDSSHDPRRRPGYRLPKRGGEPAEEDAFALLVLMASCAILADASVPIDHQKAPDGSHPMLLFSSWDLMDPRRSRLVREIEGELTAVSAELLDLVIEACTSSPDRVPGYLREGVKVIRRSVSRPDDPGALAGTKQDWHLIPAHVESADRSAADRPGNGVTPPTAPALDDVVANAVPQWDSDTSWPTAGWGVSEDRDEREVDPGASWPDVPPSFAPEPDEANGTRFASWESPGSASAGVSRRADVAALVERVQAIGDLHIERDRTSRKARRTTARQQQVSAELQDALAHNDRDALVRLAMSGSLAELGTSHRSDLLQVVRALSHDALARAMASDDDGMIVAAVDETVFEQDVDLDPAFRERVRLAKARMRWTDQLADAVRDGDAGSCSTLMDDPPAGAVDRLPEAMRRQASHLMERDSATQDAIASIEQVDAEGLVRSLRRLALASPVWTDHVDMERVEAVLGIEQIADHLMRALVRGPISLADQWMVDMVVSAGLLPEVTRRAGLSPREVDVRINGGDADVAEHT